jgi:hypothetical protein
MEKSPVLIPFFEPTDSIFLKKNPLGEERYEERLSGLTSLVPTPRSDHRT